MKKLFLIAGLMSALVFTSCKKDKDDDNNNGGDGDGNPPVTKLLKKMTKVEGGITTVYNFTYDNAKRLTSFVSTDGEESTKFSYDAAGNLTKIESIEEDVKNIYTYTWTNNLPVSGTFKSWELTAGEPDDLIEDDILTYTLTGNQVTKIRLEMTQVQDVTEFNLTYANGNLSKVQSAQNGLYTATFVFGTKKSAFPQVTKYVLDQAGFSLYFGSKNELITSSFDFPGTQLDNTITQQFTYDASGYPLTSNDGETQLKYEYQ
jgi:YD repeat-containing protein